MKNNHKFWLIKRVAPPKTQSKRGHWRKIPEINETLEEKNLG